MLVLLLVVGDVSSKTIWWRPLSNQHHILHQPILKGDDDGEIKREPSSSKLDQQSSVLPSSLALPRGILERMCVSDMIHFRL